MTRICHYTSMSKECLLLILSVATQQTTLLMVQRRELQPANTLPCESLLLHASDVLALPLFLSLARLATLVRLLAHETLRKRGCGPRFACRWRLIPEI